MGRKRVRGTRYGAEFRALRKAMIAAYVPGQTRCWRCGLPITDTDTRKVILGHSDDHSRIMGPEHRACNNRGARLYRAALARAAEQALRTGGTVTVLHPRRPAPAGVPAHDREPAWREKNICTSEYWQNECRFGPYPARHPPGRCW
jgi:hypothetical protein